MKSLNEDLKTGVFKQIYLLTGEERYLKAQYKERLSKGIVDLNNSMNYNYFEGKGIDYREVIDIAETMPFLSERRLIVIENSGFFKNATPEFAEYLKELPETTFFLFIESEIDKRGKMFKSVKDKGRIIDMNVQDERTLILWIGSLIKQDGKKITDASAKYLVEKVGTDMERISKEVEKVLCYAMERDVVTTKDIDEVCVTQISNHIFDMVNAVADKKQKLALEYYYELLALKEPPMRILFLLVRQFRLLRQVKVMSGRGHSNKEIASGVGLHPFVVGKYIEQGKRFQNEELRKIIEDAADTEEAVKTGRLTDVLSVELFIVKYSMIV